MRLALDQAWKNDKTGNIFPLFARLWRDGKSNKQNKGLFLSECVMVYVPAHGHRYCYCKSHMPFLLSSLVRAEFVSGIRFPEFFYDQPFCMLFWFEISSMADKAAVLSRCLLGTCEKPTKKYRTNGTVQLTFPTRASVSLTYKCFWRMQMRWLRWAKRWRRRRVRSHRWLRHLSLRL